MKKFNFKWLAVLCMAIGFVTVAKAQIYSSENCFYSKEGSSSVQYVVKFEGNRVWLKSVSHSTVRSNLAKSNNFYESEVWTDGKNSVKMYEYDSYRSTSVREVYKRTEKYTSYYNMWNMWVPNPVPGGTSKTTVTYYYVAFSKDKSSFISWLERENNYDGKTENMNNYTRVPKEDLLPKAVNDDFLY
jgi:hypothetical protein